MKNIALILITSIAVLFTSCEHDPYADFIASETAAEVGELVYFTNRSVDAVDYEWDFDDGYIAYNYNVSHHWEETGIYTITLSAYGKDGKVDRSFMDIEIYQPTADLEVIVLEYYDEYAVSNASVRLYPTIYDWEQETNMIAEGWTDTNGSLLFTGLEPNRRYYVDVWEESHDNYQLAEEDAAWIETQVVQAGELNTFYAYVDYYSPAKKKLGLTRKELKQKRADEIPKENRRLKEESGKK